MTTSHTLSTGISRNESVRWSTVDLNACELNAVSHKSMYSDNKFLACAMDYPSGWVYIRCVRYRVHAINGQGNIPIGTISTPFYLHLTSLKSTCGGLDIKVGFLFPFCI